MNLLLTGSTSFVGRHLRPLLSAGAHRVTHLVRSSQGLPGESVWDFRSALPTSLGRPDVIVHLAAKPYFGPALDAEQYAVNVLATGSLARLAHESGALMIFASAAIVHGGAPRIGRDTPLAPECHYAMTKVLAEGVIGQWTENHLMLRIGGIYGLDGPSHLGLNRSISAAYHQRTAPRLKGDGLAKRNYIFAGDVGRWITALGEEWCRGERRCEKVLYLAGPETLTLKDYLTTVARTLTDAGGPVMEEGAPASDFILEGDPAPFPLTHFEEYMISLKRTQATNG